MKKLLMVFAFFSMSCIGLWTIQSPPPRDEFTQAIDQALDKNNRNITKLLGSYIKTGDDIEDAKKFLETRAFTIYQLESNPNKHYAVKESIKNPIISTRTVITLETNGSKIIKVRGEIFLTGI